MPPAWVWGSCAVLVLGMVLSAAVNHSAISLHHAIKIAVIGMCFCVAWRLVGFMMFAPRGLFSGRSRARKAPPAESHGGVGT